MVIKRFRIPRFIESRWFALIDLGLVLISGALWYGWPELNAWPLLLGLMPWGIRIAAGHPPIQRTPLNIPLLLFVLTAIVGVWAAYDRETALGKFWIIVSAVLLFFALANQPRANLWLIAGTVGFLGFALACFFLLSHDWGEAAVKFETINQVSTRWMTIRPFSFPSKIHPNGAAGIMAMTIPFILALGLYSWRKRNVIIVILAAIAFPLATFGLWLTSSRGAWGALGAVLLCWLFWEGSGVIAKRIQLKQGVLFAIALSLVLLFSLVMVLLSPGPLDSLRNNGGYASLDSRQQLARDAIYLVEDFPITGGGLGSFPGLYSQYILVVPFFNLINSHNIFLDAALEQGVLGAVLLIIIFLVTAYLLIRYLTQASLKSNPSHLLALALLSGLGVVSIHGLVYDVLYGNRGSTLVFLFSGLTMGLIRMEAAPNSQESVTERLRRHIKRYLGQRSGGIIVVGLLILVFGSGFSLRDIFLGTWYANLGAVELARVELETWPTNEWGVMTSETELDSLEKNFHRALVHQPDQRTAHYRLGLIAMMRQDFSTAVSHLGQAYAHAIGHHGIKKNLGFSYVWHGDYESAKTYLTDIPEAKEELSVYVWWWGTQGRSDLSLKAEHMLEMLNSAG